MSRNTENSTVNAPSTELTIDSAMLILNDEVCTDNLRENPERAVDEIDSWFVEESDVNSPKELEQVVQPSNVERRHIISPQTNVLSREMLARIRLTKFDAPSVSESKEMENEMIKERTLKLKNGVGYIKRNSRMKAMKTLHILLEL